MRRISLSPTAYRWITFAAAILLAVIIVTGAAVRLTKSGLGCPVGLSCPESQLQTHRASSGDATVVLVSGTVVTGAGPQSGGGKHGNVAGIDVPFVDVVRVHSGLVWIFLATVIATVLVAHRDRAPRAVMQRFTVLLVVLIVQGVIGY